MNESKLLEAWKFTRRMAEEQTLLQSAYLTDVDIVNGWALPLRNGKPALPVKSGFGWSQDHINHIMTENWADVPASMNLKNESVVLLSFPGGYTYGHWIVDISARLEVARELVDISKTRFVSPGPMCAWMIPFLAAHGIAPEQCIDLGVPDKIHVDKLLVPSFMRVNDFLPEWPYNASFDRLRTYGGVLAAAAAPGIGRAKRLWVKRTVTVASRPGLDESSLADLMEDFGFTAITPGDLSIGEQAALFSSAEIVVGEDSSSLHNIVWGRPRLLVVLNSSERVNPLHLSMCRLLGATCRYVFGESQADGSFSTEPDDLRAILTEAEVFPTR